MHFSPIWGGFFLESPGSESFPIDAEQLFRLVKGGYIAYPDLDVADIQDKSKSDSLARMIAIGQAAWFFVNCIIRTAQHLFLTTLELTTLSSILIFFVTSFCWHNKPKDISRAIILSTTTPIALIRSKYIHALKSHGTKHHSISSPARNGSLLACGATMFRFSTISISQFSPGQVLSLMITCLPIPSCVLLEQQRYSLFRAS
ncbi:uncharacterized protein N7483_002145 [Penicillium malachiteum]|uniref:uncharacterized protein n=1 Tax=Penicillium malachiteum TaxID=1324776 RepID=UPI00254850C2|nr:uncharacterized protein N7483_002145 [Penicillium malachiteum]KAJ5737020.1 hypothetical protein N7483_002145 [Penicillium malachiteum]